MKQPRDPEALLSAYLADGMEVLPDRVVDAILDEAHRTRQRTVFGRRSARSTYRTALAAAAVVAAVALGGAFLVIERGLPTVAGPTSVPSVGPGPSEQGLVAPSSTLGQPSVAPTPSAVTSSTGAWIPTGLMGTPRSGFAAVRLLDGRVLVAGGSDGQADLTTAELYDPATGIWSATGSMIHPHGYAFGATLLRDGRVLVGDVIGADTEHPTYGAELYDPASGIWSAAASQAIDTGFRPTATLLADGKVLVAGEGGSQLYDPDGGTWTTTGKMVMPRFNFRATLLPDGRVLVTGGEFPTKKAELYDPGSGTWTAAADMLEAHQGHDGDGTTATLLPDGTVLVTGRGSAELYDPATGTWTATREQPNQEATHRSATLLPDGTVLFAGAMGVMRDPRAAVIAELYDPATGAWTETASTIRGQLSENPAEATLLLDGTVLVVGATDSVTDAAELYVPAGVPAPPAVVALPTPTPTPIPTPTPTPTPIPSLYPPAAGPVPAGARSWTVTVVNKSSEPATLFLAEDDPSAAPVENLPGKLCGSVTPNVVPAGVTQKVTFLLPPKSNKDCWLWVDPAPGTGGSLFQTSDAPMPGKILVGPGEKDRPQGGWLGT